MVAQLTGGQQRPRGGEQGVVVALRRAAGVAVDRGLGRGAADPGFVVGGVAHSGCGQFGEDGVDGGPRFGGQPSADRADAVDILAADGQAAAFGAVDVGEVAVGVEAVGELVGQFRQLVGAVLTGQAGQLRFGCAAGLDVNEIRQAVKEAADHRDMAGTEVAVALGGRGGFQHRRQRLAVERPPLTQVGGLMHPPRGLGPVDRQPVRQHRGQPATQLDRAGLFGELIDQRVFDGGQHSPYLFAVLQHGEPFGSGQHVERQIHRALLPA